MTDLFPAAEFDDWAASYDSNIAAGGGFPFEGYARVLKTVFELSGCKPGEAVLDLGVGTGNLSLLFTNASCRVWGIDFSPKMLALAKVKLPAATLGVSDLRADWPAEFQRQFHHIVSAYAFHHFPLAEKVALVQQLLGRYLHSGGRVIIGDIAFRDAAEEDAARVAAGDEWEQEYYWLADESAVAFSEVGIAVKFYKESAFAGVFQFKEE